MNTVTLAQAALEAQQQALLAALFGGTDAVSGLVENVQRARGLQAYRSNGHAVAERALAAAYPVVAALLGPDAFAQLARTFWHRHPPQRGDLAQWGDALPAFMQAVPDLQGLPYLPDVARLEWLLHTAAGAQDAEMDAASFGRLTREDTQQLGLCLAPGTALLRSAHPVVSIVLAHRDDGPDFDTVSLRLRSGLRETALVWRAGLRPRLCAVGETEATLIEHLLAGHSLPDALTAIEAFAEPLDFSDWLPQAVQAGLLLGVCDVVALPTPAAPPPTGETA